MRSLWWVGALGAATAVVAACSSFRDADNDTAPDAGVTIDATAPPNVDAAPDASTTPEGSTSCSSELASDPMNCGSCGHSCLGGMCSAGVCQPFEVASFTGSTDVIGVAADATHVAWLYDDAESNRKLGLIAQTASTNTNVNLMTFSSDPTALVATDSAIFAAGEGGENSFIERIGADGQPTIIENASAGYFYANAMFASDALYVVNASQPDHDDVYSLPFDATTSTSPTVIGSFGTGQGGISDLVMASNIPFVKNGLGIFVVPPTAGGFVDFCSYMGECTQGAAAMATDGTTIYWVDTLANLLGCTASVGHCGGTKQYATSSQIPEQTVAMTWDGTKLILGTAVGGSDSTAKIYACTPTGCGQTQMPLVREKPFAGRIFANATAIYWIADDGALDGSAAHSYRVMRLAK